MADLITIKRGALGRKVAMPKLNEGELGYCTDKGTLNIGTDTGNEKVGDVGWETRITELETLKTTISDLQAAVTVIDTTIGTIDKSIQDINSRLGEIDTAIQDITARLDALTPSE